MTDKQIKEEIKQVVTNLGNIKFTVEDELEFCKQVLKRKEQECEELRKQYNCYACDTCKGKEDYINLKRHCENAIKSLHNKQAELDQLKFDYVELEKRHNDSFEQFKELKSENEHLSEKEEEARHYLKEAEKFKDCLTEIKEIAEEQRNSCDFYWSCEKCTYYCYSKQILQKISEVENAV